MISYSCEALTRLSPQVFFLSEKNMSGQTLIPRVPNNEFVKWGIEDGTTPRVSFARSIAKCLTGIGRDVLNKTFYVFVPENDVSKNIVYPSKQQVPDVHITHEVWITCPVKLKYLKMIKVTAKGKQHKFVVRRKDIDEDYVGYARDWEYEVVKTPVEEIKDIFSKIRYGLRDPKTNKPWRDTHKSTTEADYERVWRLATPEQTIKAGMGVCYDTVAISREYLSKQKKIQYKTFFMVVKDGGFMDCPTHTFLIYWDTDDNWKWLEGSWGPFKHNKWSSKNPKDLIKWIGTAMANMENEEISVHELSSYPKYGCDMKEFETFCRKAPIVATCKPERK